MSACYVVLFIQPHILTLHIPLPMRRMQGFLLSFSSFFLPVTSLCDSWSLLLRKVIGVFRTMSSDGKEAHNIDGVAIDFINDGDDERGNAADRADMYRMGKVQEMKVRADSH